MRRRTLITMIPATTVLAAVVALTTWWYATASELQRLLAWMNLTGGTVVVVGDSITEQAKLENGGEGYLTFIAAKYPRITFINEGVGGNTTKSVIDRLSSISQYAADGYIFAIGVNDARYFDPRGAQSDREFIANYSMIIEACLQHGGWGAVISLWPSFPNDRFAAPPKEQARQRIVDWNGDLAELAWERGLVFVDAYSAIVRNITADNQPYLVSDGIHPSNREARLIYAAAVVGRPDLLRE